ncbi:hypothetical protein DM01DRAFT_1228003 [Hesseltinella vesiculosa]|uniref:Uncharacterized protein n=1 Tax=Hesseltinella vesiculosa TaxID=101127 RepID=A0A1X2GMV1_9FUNG|nr:hypothetical protein DM01DRAFT_1228003 [Hesseltinella vesiculosa]
MESTRSQPSKSLWQGKFDRIRSQRDYKRVNPMKAAPINLDEEQQKADQLKPPHHRPLPKGVLQQQPQQDAPPPGLTVQTASPPSPHIPLTKPQSTAISSLLTNKSTYQHQLRRVTTSLVSPAWSKRKPILSLHNVSPSTLPKSSLSSSSRHEPRLGVLCCNGNPLAAFFFF